MGGFDTRNTLKISPEKWRIPFGAIKRDILGEGYSLSLVICGDSLSQKLNRTYRNKTYKPNVLSFPLDRTQGEIFLNVRKAEREAASMGIALRSRLALLYVHACFHLKGYDHGDLMEKKERAVLKKFGL